MSRALWTMFWVGAFFGAVMGVGICHASLIPAVGEVSIKAQQFLPGAFDPNLPTGQPNQELNLNLDTHWGDYFYWNNTIHSYTDASQFREIGWEFQLGVKPAAGLSVFFEHYSQHLLDAQWPYPFPRYFGVGMKLDLYKEKHDGI